MPLFMDRHNGPFATAKDVAEAHVRDLVSAAKHSVEFLSYWFDTDSRAAFCLATAPAPENLVAVHRESHGQVPNEIIGVAEDDLFRFLGRIRNPHDATEVTSAFRTILFTDWEGSTEILDRLGDAKFLALLGEHDTIIRRAIFNCRGREVKHTGDGVMVVFTSVADALSCACEVQAGFAARTVAGREPELRVRIGMAAGEPVNRDDDLYGSTVVLASRICDTAEGGQSLASNIVRTHGAPHGYPFRDAGFRLLKGFSAPVEVFELLSNDTPRYSVVTAAPETPLRSAAPGAPLPSAAPPEVPPRA